MTRISSGIWPESFYPVTVNYWTTSESGPRVLHSLFMNVIYERPSGSSMWLIIAHVTPKG